MKTLWTAVILMFSFSCIADPAMRNSTKRAPLRGKVKKVRSSGYGALSEARAKSLTFDTSRYSIDSFSKAGLKLYTYWIWDGGIADRVNYKYDAKGNKTGEYTYSKEFGKNERRTFTYDLSGNLAKERICGAGNNVERNIKYTYAGGRLIEKDFDSVERTTYAYNDEGKLIEENIYYFPHSEKTTTTFTYDDSGRIVSETRLYGSGGGTTTYKYDEHDNEVLAEEHAQDGTIGMQFVTEYIYDSQGNWIRCIEDYPNDIDDIPAAKQVSIREIEYY